MNLPDLEKILAQITYKDWDLKLGFDGQIEQNQFWIQWKFWAPNSYTGEPELQSCRKWKLSEHMTSSEVVGTAFKAALSAEEHECRETFKYKNQPIFGPHINVEILADIYKNMELNEVLDSRPKTS